MPRIKNKDRQDMPFCLTPIDKGIKCVLSNLPTLIPAAPVDENFSTIVILELLLDLELDATVKDECLRHVQALCQNDVVYFFADKHLYPADVDTTALALVIGTKSSCIPRDQAAVMIDKILSNTASNGAIDVYYDPTGEKKERIDQVVCANALYALTLHDRQHAAEKTIDFVFQTIVSGSYCKGSRYYPSEDTFLWSASKLVADFPDTYGSFESPLKAAVMSTKAHTRNSLDLAMHIIASENLHLPNATAKAQLAAQQQPDGGWPASPYFKGSGNRYFGSREITTAFALKALAVHQKPYMSGHM